MNGTNVCLKSDIKYMLITLASFPCSIKAYFIFIPKKKKWQLKNKEKWAKQNWLALDGNEMESIRWGGMVGRPCSFVEPHCSMQWTIDCCNAPFHCPTNCKYVLSSSPPIGKEGNLCASLICAPLSARQQVQAKCPARNGQSWVHLAQATWHAQCFQIQAKFFFKNKASSQSSSNFVIYIYIYIEDDLEL